MSRLLLIAVAASAGLSLTTPAAALGTGSYSLHNHPDGNAAEPFYGLRLDDLLGTGIYTFDFDNAAKGSEMRLDFDGINIHIYGQAWGGLDTGSTYSSATIWAIDFTYAPVSTLSGDGEIADVQALLGGGTISSDLGSFNLIAFSGDNDYAFQIGDEDGSGHRGFDGISGWGWLNYFSDGGDPDHHVYSSDWLFTAETLPAPVPIPGALWLLASGFLGLSLVGRRQRSV